jgi:hypothetical protein
MAIKPEARRNPLKAGMSRCHRDVMNYQARCHCGRVRFSFRSPEITGFALRLLALRPPRGMAQPALHPGRGFHAARQPGRSRPLSLEREGPEQLFLQDLRNLHLHRRRREREGRLSRQPRLRRGAGRIRAGGETDRRQVGAGGGAQAMRWHQAVQINCTISWSDS